MPEVIRIDSEVFKKLQEKAKELGIPFSSPNNILRIVLGLEPIKGPRHQPELKAPLCQGWLCDICVADCRYRITSDKAKKN